MSRQDWQPPKWSRRGAVDRTRSEANATVVLVVDDDESFRRSVAKILRTVGYTVIQAADGLDALRLLTTMRFHVMVLDLKLPRLDGDRLLRTIPNPPPVVVVSGYELDAESQRRGDDRVVAYLRKPVQPEELLGSVEAAARRRRGTLL